MSEPFRLLDAAPTLLRGRRERFAFAGASEQTLARWAPFGLRAVSTVAFRGADSDPQTGTGTVAIRSPIGPPERHARS